MEYAIHIAARGKTIVETEHFELPENRITFLFGESGIGKSLLARAVYGLLDPARLSITINNKPYSDYLNSAAARQFRERGFFVFQEPSSHLNPLLLLRDQLNEGSLEAAANEEEVLQQLWDGSTNTPPENILDIYPRPYRPSGGEKQRVLLAMAFKKLSLLPTGDDISELFVFDEPTGSLDNHFRNQFLKLLFDEFRRRAFTTLVITHDYSIISEIYRSHSDLKPQIAFRELRRAARLEMHTFAAKDYLNWLEDTTPAATSLHQTGQEPLLSLQNHYRVFGREMNIHRGTQKISCDLEIYPGEIVYLKAASGIGKTTLAKIVLGLTRADRMILRLAGREFSEKTPQAMWRKHIWGRKAGMVFQHADEALNLNASVQEVFSGLPRERRPSDQDLRQLLEEWFSNTIDETFLKKPVKLLSGGQKQRLNLLRTFSLATDLLVLDEPLNGLDFRSIQRILQSMEAACAAGRAILLISHNEEIFDALIPPEKVFYLT